MFQVNVDEIGSIMKIRVVDSLGLHSNIWSVEDITLKDQDTKEELKFFYNQNIGKSLDGTEVQSERPALRHEQPVLPSE